MDRSIGSPRTQSVVGVCGPGVSVFGLPSKWLLVSFLTSTLGYGYSEAILFWTKHAINSRNESSEDREVENCLERNMQTLLTCRSCRFFFLSPILSCEELCHIHVNMA